MTKLMRRIYIVIGVSVLAIPGPWALVQRSDAFAVASAHIKNNAQVHARLGDLKDVSLPLFGYGLRVTGARGDANFTLGLKGSTSSATAYVELKKQGTWRPTASHLVLQDGTVVDLSP